MKDVKISILVPIYNAEKYIVRCAKSLFGQTYDNIEFVFVNDCTPDNSIKILRDILNEYPERKIQTKIISHKRNLGVAAARNTLLDNATGDYILWVDADDFIGNKATEILAAKVAKTKADIVCYGTAIYSAYRIKPFKLINITTSKNLIFGFLSSSITTSLWGYMVKRCLFINNSIKFIETLDIGEDLYVLTQLAWHAKNIDSEQTVLYYWDITNENSLVHSYTVQKAQKELELLDVLDDFLKDKLDVSLLIAERRLDCYLFNVYNACLNNDKQLYIATKKDIKCLYRKNITVKKNVLYRFFIVCNNYTLNRWWSYLMYFMKIVEKRFNKIMKILNKK